MAATETLRARVAAAVAEFSPGAAVPWPNGLGFDHDTSAGTWEFCTRDDGSWSARFIEAGDTLPVLQGFGSSHLDACRSAQPTEWAAECRAGERAFLRAVIRDVTREGR